MRRRWLGTKPLPFAQVAQYFYPQLSRQSIRRQFIQWLPRRKVAELAALFYQCASVEEDGVPRLRLSTLEAHGHMFCGYCISPQTFMANSEADGNCELRMAFPQVLRALFPSLQPVCPFASPTALPLSPSLSLSSPSAPSLFPISASLSPSLTLPFSLCFLLRPLLLLPSLLLQGTADCYAQQQLHYAQFTELYDNFCAADKHQRSQLDTHDLQYLQPFALMSFNLQFFVQVWLHRCIEVPLSFSSSMWCISRCSFPQCYSCRSGVRLLQSEPLRSKNESWACNCPSLHGTCVRGTLCLVHVAFGWNPAVAPVLCKADSEKTGMLSFLELLVALFPLVPVWVLNYTIRFWPNLNAVEGGPPQDTRSVCPRRPSYHTTCLTEEHMLYVCELFNELDTDGVGELSCAQVCFC